MTAEEFHFNIRLLYMPANESLFTVEDGGMLTGYTGNITNLVIPPVIQGVVILTIAGGPSASVPGVFGNRGLTNVTIPNTVRVIGERAFMNNQLTNLIIPDSVIYMGLGAFANNQLSSVTIPNTLTSIRRSVFLNNHLTSITIPNSVRTIEYQAFRNNRLTSVIIPNNVVSIGDRAFQGVENRITTLIIPNGVTSIGSRAFAGNQLTSLIIPDSVRSIGANAFVPLGTDAGVLNFVLTSVSIGANVTLDWRSLRDGFTEFYAQNGRRAGTYTLSGSGRNETWTFTQ